MKFALRAVLVAASIGSIPPAIASEVAPTAPVFAGLPGVIAEAPNQNVASIATAQNGQAAVQGDTQPGHGQWLFPPIGKYLDQYAGG